MKNDLNLYVQFTKTDDEQHIVEGIASSEDLDSQGEVVKYAAIKKALPDYMKFGNIREMHSYSAVGKAIKAIPDDARKCLYIAAKIIDPVAWQKVKEGVYNGFSIGGRVLKQVGNEIEGMTLNEISIVDRPANPAALFSLVKFDKGTEAKEVKKDAVAQDSEEEDTYKGPAHVEVLRASYVLNIAADLCMLYDMYQMNGIDTTEVDQAIDLLKDMVSKEMTTDNDAEKAAAQAIADLLTKFQNRKDTKAETEEAQKAEKQMQTAAIRKTSTQNLYNQSAWIDPYFAEAKKVLG